MKLLVSGYYGFGNLGDEALLAGLLMGLGAHAVTVLSGRPGDTRALHGVGTAHRLRGLPALMHHDALLSGGGGLLQDKTSARSLRYYLGVIALAKRLGKRVVVYGQSVGPLSPEGRRAVARTLRGVPVAVRDGASQRLLAGLGVRAALAADAALLLPKPAPRSTDPVPPDGAPVLLVPRGGYPQVTAALARLAAALHAEGVALAGLALHPSEDAGALAELPPAVRRLSAPTPQAVLELVAGSRYVVSARLHGLILAARAGRPFSGVAYDPKVAAFLAEAGGRVHPVPPDPEVLMQEVFNPVFDVNRVAALEARARGGLTWLEAALSAPAR